MILSYIYDKNGEIQDLWRNMHFQRTKVAFLAANWNAGDIDVGRLKVNQGQTWCQSLGFKVIRGRQVYTANRKPLMVSCLTYFESTILFLTVFEIFDIEDIFHRDIGKNKFHFRFGGHGYFGFPPKTIGDHVFWDSTLVASLVKVGRKLRPVQRSTRLCDRLTDTQTKWLYNLSDPANAVDR